MEMLFLYNWWNDSKLEAPENSHQKAGGKLSCLEKPDENAMSAALNLWLFQDAEYFKQWPTADKNILYNLRTSGVFHIGAPYEVHWKLAL